MHPKDLLVGRTIAGKYLIESSVGSGAMGTVYRARQIALDKIVAMKVLRREFEQNREFVARFSVEARAASKLDHPNSTRVMDFGREPDGLLYIAMEYLEGRDLYEAMREEGPFSAERIANVLAQALAGVAVAHELGILHRDLKPENIMLLPTVDDEGRSTDLVKVCDFGIAKLSGFTDLHEPSAPVSTPVSGSHRLTRMGNIIGTPAYMSPEQACGEPADARSDIYAVGVILFEMLTGRVPFEGATPEDTVNMHLSAEPPSPFDLNPMCSPELARICIKAMQKTAAARYSTARDMRADIRSVMMHDFGVAPSGPLPLSQPRMMTGSSSSRSSEPRMEIDTATMPQMAEIARPKPRPPATGKRNIALLAGAVLLLGIGAAAFARPKKTPTPPPALTHVDAPASPTGVLAVAPAPDTQGDKVDLAVVHRDTMAAVPPVGSPDPKGAPTTQTGALAARGRAPAAGARTTPSPKAEPPPVAAAPAAPLATPLTAVAAPEPAPVAAPPVVAAPSPPPATPPPVVSTPAAPAFDPARARIDVGALRTDRMSPRDANAILGRADLKSCYVASVKAGEPAAPGSVTVNLEVEDMRVARAKTSGASSSTSLRRCIESRLVGSRVPSADTGSATASIPLSFSTQ